LQVRDLTNDEADYTLSQVEDVLEEAEDCVDCGLEDIEHSGEDALDDVDNSSKQVADAFSNVRHDDLYLNRWSNLKRWMNTVELYWGCTGVSEGMKAKAVSGNRVWQR
jgi:hypothetical protein